MNILVVYNVVETIEQGEEDDLLAEQESSFVEQAIAKALQQHGHRTAAVPIRDDLDRKSVV